MGAGEEEDGAPQKRALGGEEEAIMEWCGWVLFCGGGEEGGN